MAMASPTPMPGHLGGPRRQASRQHIIRQIPPRPHLNRQNALPPSAPGLHIHPQEPFSIADSSDDDIAPPIFNKATNRLLEGEHSILDPSSPAESLLPRENPSVAPNSHARSARASLLDSLRDSNIKSRQDGKALPRRIVRLSGTPGSSAKRSSSLQSSVQRYNDQSLVNGDQSPVTTPAQIKRMVRIPISSTLKHSTASSLIKQPEKADHELVAPNHPSGESDQEYQDDPASVARTHAVYGSVTKFGTSGRARYGDDTGVPQSTMRVVKRVGAIHGSYLRGPARRGRRRQSEEERERENETHNEIGNDSAYASQDRHDLESPEERQEEPLSSPVREPEIGLCAPTLLKGEETVSTAAIERYTASKTSTHQRSESPVPTMSIAHHLHMYDSVENPIRAAVRVQQPVSKLAHLPPDLPSVNDKENDPPPYKFDKPASSLLDLLVKAPVKSQAHEIRVNRVDIPLEREVLALRSKNTPKRAAPPAPPRMSVLETATAAGGAATAVSRQKRSMLRVNGKNYTRLDVIGRGGSSKVYRVMAENGKFWALKRVALEDADESAIRGFKGEIDLLRKLEGNERVVRLLDYEMNDEKQTLTVLMEMGDLDFNKMLTLRFNSETSTFDPAFTRHYWKEMLECIQAVHAQDIVHSDLKPANFVLVQGQLKLIDFGIANAIEIDETVNVHRDTQIGTPNYMSPESLIEANELPYNKGIPNAISEKKIWKIGKPSDIWSLGCILYQMSYGRQPFAHIANQMSRCRAIIDFGYAIEYPAVGVGGVPLPHSLICTMKKCLNRDLHARPTVEELLVPTDAWLYPREVEEGSIVMTEELLGRILQNVAAKCKDRMPSEHELLSVWPAGYFASLRKQNAGG